MRTRPINYIVRILWSFGQNQTHSSLSLSLFIFPSSSYQNFLFLQTPLNLSDCTSNKRDRSSSTTWPFSCSSSSNSLWVGLLRLSLDWVGSSVLNGLVGQRPCTHGDQLSKITTDLFVFVKNLKFFFFVL